MTATKFSGLTLFAFIAASVKFCLKNKEQNICFPWLPWNKLSITIHSMVHIKVKSSMARSLPVGNLKYELIWFVHTICIYFRFGCKLNSLVLVDLLNQNVYTGRWLHHTPQVYNVVICNRVIELSLQLLILQITHIHGYKNVRWFTLSTEGSLYAWLEANMRVYHMMSRQRMNSGWQLEPSWLEQSGVRTMYVTEKIRIKYWKVFL